MSRKIANVTFALLAMFLLIISHAMATAPQTMPYQGRLADADGNAITVEVSVLFSIYAAAEGGSPIWTETHLITPDQLGVFTVELGTEYVLSTTVFNGSARFLAIKVGDDDEMAPRQLLASAPYAINSSPNRLDGQVKFGDSTMILNDVGISMGSNSVSPQSSTLLRLYRTYNNTSGLRYGIWSDIYCTEDGAGVVGCFFGAHNSATAAGIKYAIYGRATGSGTNYAGYFDGNVSVTGTLSKGAGSFKIDHPLDPANKYLQHSFVESPDMMNVYNGNVITDESGYATVTLPDYFQALNQDFRYQLTVLGEFAQAIISDEISDNRFVIRTDKPSVKVSWQVTGIRKDAYAEAHRIKVEVDKDPIDKGLYLHPGAFKLDKAMSIDQNRIPDAAQDSGESHD